MRILIVHKTPPFIAGGAEKIIWQTAKRLASNGHQVTFFSPRPGGSTEPPEVSAIDFRWVDTTEGTTRSQLEFFVKGPRAYPSVYKEVDPDLVCDNICPFPFHIAHFYGSAPVVSKVHAIYRRDAFSCKSHPLVQVGTIFGEETYRIFRDELFITNSESTKERLEPLLNTEKNEVVVNPIGIDVSQFDFNVAPDSTTVLSLTKLNPRKDISTLLEAWEIVESEIEDANLVIAGSGPSEPKLKETASELELSRVSFPGFVSEDEKLRLYEEASIYSLPTLYEGFGLSNLEAMASGCAVVSTSTWGVKDYLRNGENGLAVEPGSAESLAKALIHLLESPDEIERLAKNGRETAQSYSIEDSLRKEIAIIEEYGEDSDE